MFNSIGVEALSACVPKNIVDNGFFASLFTPKELRVFEKTVGIVERRWAPEGLTSLDLGFEAATDLFDRAQIDSEEVGALIFMSQTPEYKIPFTSNILQDKLKLKQNILCLDINAGCAGFIQGLSTAFSITKNLNGKKTLVVIAETLSKILSRSDRSTSLLFGDGAAAFIVSEKERYGDSFFDFYSDGGKYSAIMIPDGGYRNPFNSESLSTCTDDKGNTFTGVNLQMDGSSVFDFTMREISPSILRLSEEIGRPLNTFDFLLLHQSNAFIIKQIASQLAISPDHFPLNISRYGNTSGVSIPLLIADFRNTIKSSNLVMLSGYGSGLNWGNAVMDLSKADVFPIFEI